MYGIFHIYWRKLHFPRRSRAGPFASQQLQRKMSIPLAAASGYVFLYPILHRIHKYYVNCASSLLLCQDYASCWLERWLFRLANGVGGGGSGGGGNGALLFAGVSTARSLLESCCFCRRGIIRPFLVACPFRASFRFIFIPHGTESMSFPIETKKTDLLLLFCCCILRNP